MEIHTFQNDFELNLYIVPFMSHDVAILEKGLEKIN